MSSRKLTMRAMIWMSGAVVLASLAGAYALGCSAEANDCDRTLECAYYYKGTGGSTSSSSTGEGGTGGTPSTCIPSESDDPVAGSCGVFVSSSLGADDTAADRGTQAKPFKTIGAALMKSDVTRVYACAESFSESVVVSSAVELYGAVDCLKGWAYDPSKKTTLTAAQDTIPLTLGNPVGLATVEDFAISAVAAKGAGGSSIAVLANGSTASLTRCDLTAGDATAGDPGVNGGAQEVQAEGGAKGDDAGAAGTFAGGAGGKNIVCSLQAGKGGDGGVLGGDGSDGTQGDGNMGGTKGIGDTGAGCTPGGQGGNGGKGAFGPGAQGTGSMSKTGYQGVDGDVGLDGGNGKSGGGGGGSKASATVHGAGGGGGGAGGCGGKHGTGGKAGGSSIALASVEANVILAECKLSTGKGGAGGKGGDGQFGQLGGKNGDGGTGNMGVVDGCIGGKGGSGANGGNGGGGLGGHSLGIAVTGSAPTLDDATQKSITPGAQGTGGPGGNLDADMNHGAPGMAVQCWDFGTGKECSP
jgi:hypothetical protein